MMRRYLRHEHYNITLSVTYGLLRAWMEFIRHLNVRDCELIFNLMQRLYDFLVPNLCISMRGTTCKETENPKTSGSALLFDGSGIYAIGCFVLPPSVCSLFRGGDG
jgi:hypothetical protein